MNTFNIDDEMKELLDSFLVETHELLDALDQDLMKLETQPDDSELLNSIFRSFHTIKGTSSFMGFDQMTEVTHHAEDLLNKLRRSELTVTTDIVDALLEAYDLLVKLLDNVEHGNGANFDLTAILAKLQACINPGSASQVLPDSSQKAPETIGSAVDTIISAHSSDNSSDEFTEEELRLVQQAFNEVNVAFKANKTENDGAAQSQTPDNSKGKDTQPSQDAAAFTDDTAPPSVNKEAAVRDNDSSLVVTRRMVDMRSRSNREQQPDPPPIEIKAEPQHRSSADNTLRVDVQRLESLMDLSGELVLGRNRLAQITERLLQYFEDNDYIQELVKTSAEINYITSELQSAIMKTRMVPIGKLYQKAPRMIRELSKEFGKDIELLIQGEETEVDRSIIEELGDPLVHMIRNSCDHGVEGPEEREKAGKSRKGSIRLTAEHEGNHIVIRIIDDGRGMNPEKLKSKAIEKGILTREQAAQMTEHDAFNLIFAAGFSTAEKVTNVSGRGVGMDVVRTNIQKLKGTIHIDSRLGQGSVFTIKMPLTLAIIQGLLVRVREEVYALPLSSVIEVVSTADNKISTVQMAEVIRIRDQVYPLLRLENVLSIPSKSNEENGQYVVLIGLAEQRIGIVVDELMGQKEIVVKSLGDYLEDVPGIAGSTILGDGRVIMILDVAEIFHFTERPRRRVLAE